MGHPAAKHDTPSRSSLQDPSCASTQCSYASRPRPRVTRLRASITWAGFGPSIRDAGRSTRIFLRAESGDGLTNRSFNGPIPERDPTAGRFSTRVTAAADGGPKHLLTARHAMLLGSADGCCGEGCRGPSRTVLMTSSPPCPAPPAPCTANGSHHTLDWQQVSCWSDHFGIVSRSSHQNVVRPEKPHAGGVPRDVKAGGR